MSQDPTDDWSTLVLVMAWYRQATSHYLSQCWLKSMSSYHVTSPPWINYNDVIMGLMASQITSLTIVYSVVYLSADKKKHQSSVSLAFVRGIHRGPVNYPHKRPVTRKNVSIWWRYHAKQIFILGIQQKKYHHTSSWFMQRLFNFIFRISKLWNSYQRMSLWKAKHTHFLHTFVYFQ